MGTHRSIGTWRVPLAHCEISTGDAPMSLASWAALPDRPLVHSRKFIPALLATREAIAIVPREFYFFALRYRINTMKTIGEIRRENLLVLIARHGSMAALNERIGLVRTDATLSQYKNQSPDSKTGSPKSMGDAFARRMEKELGLDVGWMDNVQLPHSYRSGQISAAVGVMENMNPDQLTQAVKVLAALAEPHPKAANGK